MAQLTEREIQDTFTEAEKSAIAQAFPENSINATNENILNPPEPKETDPQEETPSAPEAPKVDASSDLMSQDDIQALVQHTNGEQASVEKADDSSHDLMSQNNVQSMNQETAPPQPAPETPAENALMSQADIEALILEDDSSSEEKETPVEEAEADVETEAEVQEVSRKGVSEASDEEGNDDVFQRLQASAQKVRSDEIPLSANDIEALAAQANSASESDYSDSELLSQDDIQSLIAQSPPQEDEDPNDLFDTRESEMLGPAVQSPSLESHPSENGMLSNDDIARLMEEASEVSAEPEEFGSQTNLEELIAKTEAIAESLARMDKDDLGSSPPSSSLRPEFQNEQSPITRETSYSSQVDPLLQKKGKEDYKKTLQAVGHKAPATERIKRALAEVARLATSLSIVTLLAFGLGTAARVYQLTQSRATQPGTGMKAWEWSANPDARSKVKWRFMAPATTGISGSVSVTPSDEFRPEEIRQSLGRFYSSRYKNNYHSVDLAEFSPNSFLVDYVFPHPKGSDMHGYVAKRSLFVKSSGKIIQVDFIRRIASVQEAVPGKPVWETMNRVLKQGLDLDVITSTVGSKFEAALKSLEEYRL